MCLDRQILLSIGGLLSRSPPLSYFKLKDLINEKKESL